MKELVLFYSYSGHTKKIAENFGREKNFDVREVCDIKRPGKLFVFTAGIIKSLKGSSRQIKPLNFEGYDVINIFAPIWAGHPTPSINGALKLIPKGMKVKLFMVSTSKESSQNTILKRVRASGLDVIGYEDIKS